MESLSEGAFEAVLAGDLLTHDRILAEKLIFDLYDGDVIVLAQASMARVVSEMPVGTLKVPVLSWPELAVRRAKKILRGTQETQLPGAAR